MARPTLPSDPRWDAYPATVIEIGEQPALNIDLRRRLGAELRLTLGRLGLGASFAIVTACNPCGRELSAEENARRSRRLREHVAAAQIVSLRADGVSPDGTHREQGLALAIDRTAAIEIAALYEQSAIFWFDGVRFQILPVLETRSAAVELPLGDLPPSDLTRDETAAGRA